MSLELGDKWKGQFFTPYDVSLITSELAFEKDLTLQRIEEDGFVEVSDECIGGGALLIALTEVFCNNKINPQKHMLVYGGDLDIKSVYMSYIHFTLYGIPAVINHQDTLTNEIFSTWYTFPCHMQHMKYKKALRDYKREQAKLQPIEPLKIGQMTFEDF